MRLTVIFAIDKMCSSYNMLFTSVIKESLKSSNYDFYEKTYFYNGNKNKVFKDLTFSVYMDKPHFDGDIVYTGGRVFLNISTSSVPMFINLYNGFLKKSEYKYKGFELKRVKIFEQKSKIIKKNEAIFKTMSAICIKNIDGHYMDITDPAYEDSLNIISNKIVTKIANRGLRERIVFEPISMKKVIVKEYIDGFRNGLEPFYVNSSKGLFRLKGDKDDLNIFLNSGIGYRRSQGFGALELIMG